MSSTIQNADSVSSFALVIGLIIVLSLLVGIGAIIYRKKYHLKFKKFFAKFKNNYNNKINGKNIKINGKNNKINGKNIKNNNNNIKNNNNNIKNGNNNIKNGNNNIKNGNGDGNGKTNKKNIKNKDDGTNYKNKNYQGYSSSNPRSKAAKNDNNVLPNNNLFLTKNNVPANKNNNNNRNISQQSKLLNHQNIEKEKEEKIRNKKHLQQPINTSVMNEITRLPTAYAPRVRILCDDNKRSKSETFSSSPLSHPSLSTSTKYLKPTQTKPFVPIKPLNSSPATSSSNKAKNDHLSIDESHYESSQNSSQAIVLNLCDYYTYDNNTIDNRHSKGNYIDSYYHNSNYSGNAKQAEDHRNYDNDTNNNENGNKIKIDVNVSPPVNVKPTSSKLKKNPYDNYSMSSSPPLEPLSPPPQSTTPPLPPPPSTLQNNESSSSSSSTSTSTSTIIRPKNFSISDSFKPLASSSPSSPTPISTPTIIRPKNFSISDSFKPLTPSSPSSPSSASRLNSWLTSSPNKNDNVKNDKFLILNQNTDGNIASSDSTPTNNYYTNNDIYDNYIYSEDENNYNNNNNHESFFMNQRKNTTAIPPAADSTHQRNLQIVTQTLNSTTPPQTPLTPRQAQLQPFRINSIVNNDNNNNSNNRNSGYVEYGGSDVSNHSSYLCSDEESIYYSKTDSVSIDPHLYDKSNTNSIYYSNDEDVDKNNSEEDNYGDDDDDDDDDVQNIINTTVLIDDASKKISRIELIKESEHEYEHRYGEDYKGGDHNEEAIVFDSRNYDNDNEINILVDDDDFNKSRISDSPIELPKLPKILVNKNLSINFERFSLFRNAPGCIDKDGYYYYDHNRNLNGNSNSNNRVANVYIKPGHG